VIGARRDYKLDDKMMSKAVLVRRELGQGCVVMTSRAGDGGGDE